MRDTATVPFPLGLQGEAKKKVNTLNIYGSQLIYMMSKFWDKLGKLTCPPRGVGKMLGS